jgi:Ca-activated chloride channel family protein
MTARLFLLAWVLAPLLLAGPAQELVAQGNTAWQANRHPEAVLLYQKALALRPDSPEALYDLGAALYRTGDFARALESFDRAARLSRRGRVAVLVRYNAGNSAFQQGLSLVNNDPRGALSLMEHALDSYREALRLDAGLRDAAYNVEVVRKWLRLLEQHFAQQQNRGAPSGPSFQGPGPRDVAPSILGRDRGIRSGAGSRTRPLTADKDW